MLAVKAYLRRHEERDDRIEALIAKVAELRGEVAALRSIQDVLAIRLDATRQIQASTCNEKFRHALLQVRREERAQIDAKFLQGVLQETEQVRLQEQKRRKLYDSEKKQFLQHLFDELWHHEEQLWQHAEQLRQH